MPHYTINPSFLEFSKKNPVYQYDILWVFLPDNSKKICLDFEEKIFNEYKTIISQDKDLTNWLSLLSFRQESSFIKVNKDPVIENLPLAICNASYDKILITEQENDCLAFKKIIQENNIILLNKEMAKINLNYDLLNFSRITPLKKFYDVDQNNVFDVIKDICDEFINLVEFNGVNKLLYANKKRVMEKNLQLIFYAVAFSYCKANDLKISPEVNSGNGPVDFNFSQGMIANINVELKFADNPKLEQGLSYQLISYNLSERTKKSIYLVVFTKDSEIVKLNQLQKVLNYRKEKGKEVPVLKIVDARIKKSASKLVS